MHKHRTLIPFCTVLISTLCASAKLPSTFKRCDKNQSDFNQCLLKAVEDAVSQLAQPFKEVGLASLDPLRIPSMSIAPGSGPTNFQQNYKDIRYSGLSKAVFSKFDINLEKKTLVMECIIPEVKMAFQYDFKGKVLVLPFFGKGPGLFTINDLKFTFNYQFEEYEKNGAKHFKIAASKLKMEPQLIRFKFDNLFNGDENLGKNINKVFNENWRAIARDVAPSYEDAFNQIFADIFNKFLAKVPVSEIF